MVDAASQVVIVARSGPGSPGARRALAMCASRAARGEPATLVLLDEAVRAAGEAGATGATVLCLEADAAMRGLSLERLPGASAVDHGEIVDALMGGAQVIGAL